MNEQDYKDIELSYFYSIPSLERRDFLKLLGGGIIVFITFGDSSILLSQQRPRPRTPTDFNAYLRVGEDGKVTIYVGKIEMGQGAITSLAQIAAEELDVSLDSIEMVMGDTDICPYDMGTFGSMTIRIFSPVFKAAAAEAKAVLIELAAEHLNTPKEQLTTEKGVIYVKGQRSKKVAYAELTKGKKIQRKLSEKAVVKAISDYTVVNKPIPRLDARDKVTGKAQFAGDIRYPGMLYAKILRPPAHRAKLKSADTSEVEKISGVKVYRDEDFIAILHEDIETAAEALNKIKADFDVPVENLNDKNIFDHLVNTIENGRESGEKGSMSTGEEQSSEVWDETYLNGYVAHATIETHTATARFEGDKLEIWISTQTPFMDRGRIAGELGLPQEKVRVRTPFVGGGFGGKTGGRQAIEAAKLAKFTGKPVQVCWSRSEEFFYDTFMPAAVVKIKSGIDNNGKITFWDYKVYAAGSRGSDQFYEVPNNLITVYGEWMGRGGPSVHPFGTGAWRAPGANTNVFAKESQIDIMAAKAGINPLEFRLKHLTDKRMIRVLNAAAEKFRWTPAKKAPSGRGYGIALGIDAGTYVASFAEVDVDKSRGNIKIKRIVCVQDMGLCINPDGAKMQMEGCITMGLGYALSEEIRFNGGKIHNTNFDSYEIPRFSWVPEIETIIIDNKNLPAQGGGEPAIVVMGAVVANAVFDACGARLFQFPMTPERVREALKRG